MQTTTERPTDSAHALESGLAIQQRERETALYAVARLRKEASAEIERLLAFLDACDPYVTNELEENGDELDASYPEGTGARLLSNPNEDDEDDDPGEDDGLREPALGSLDGQGSQIAWAAGKGGDVELDAAESGIGDYDGLLEQVGCGGFQGNQTGMG